MVRDTSNGQHMMAFLTALYAEDFRGGLAQIIRYKRLCSPDIFRLDQKNGEISITCEWPSGTKPAPYVSVEAGFALLVELGRRGTGQKISPLKVALRRPTSDTDLQVEYLGCPVHFGAEMDCMVLDATHLELSFLDHNPDMLKLISPALTTALLEIESKANFTGQVKAALKRALAVGRSDVAAVARELAVSQRTMQRRIKVEGKSFRLLLDETRQELSHQLLADGGVEINEVAFLLGYQDINSFYRAFRKWGNITPGQWRHLNAEGVHRSAD